ncbi:MAG: SLBB domain-containing protein [Desulfobacteraceae bacterium]
MKKVLFQVVGQWLLMVMFISVAYADFGLMLGSFKSRANAETYAAKVVKDLNPSAANTFVEKVRMPDDDLWYRVCLGPFHSRKAALERKQVFGRNNSGANLILVKTNARAVSESTEAPERVSSPSRVDRDPSRQGGKTRDVSLTWDIPEGASPAGHKIYYDTKSGPPYDPDPADYADEGPPPIVVKDGVHEITLHGLTASKTYYFSVTAFDDPEGPESDFSMEVVKAPEHTTPQQPPASSPPEKVREDIIIERKAEPREEKLQPAPVQSKAGIGTEGASGTLIPEEYTVPEENAQTIAAGDTLAIGIPGQPEMSREYDVAPDGNIYMMSVGRIPVQGLSLRLLERKLEPKLKNFLVKGEKISLQITHRERYVRITGGVQYPGWYHVPAVITLKKLIETTGGLLEGSTYSGIKLRRKTTDGHREMEVEGREKEIKLQPDDVIIVPMPKVYQTKVDSGDLLFINVPGRGQKEGQYLQDKIHKLNQFEVDRNGYVYISDVGHIYVQDLTTAEIRQAIEKKLPKYLARDSKMDISIIEKRQFVEVLGHVANPGWYTVNEAANVQAALNLAGGAIDGAIMSDANILRKKGEETERLKINLYQFSITGDPRLLTPLHANDTLFIPISPNFGNVKRTLMPWSPPTERLEKDVKQKVRILGAVRNPGIYEPKEDMTLLDLLILASGERDDADLSKISIIREGKIDETFNLQSYFNKESQEPIPMIKNGDTVYVKFRELTVFEPEEDKVFYVLGEVKSPNEYKLADNMTLFQAISLAGGLTEWADADNITLIRMVDGKQQTFRYNFENGLAGRVPEWNIYIKPNDTIYVP